MSHLEHECENPEAHEAYDAMQEAIQNWVRASAQDPRMILTDWVIQCSAVGTIDHRTYYPLTASMSPKHHIDGLVSVLIETLSEYSE